MNFKVLPFPPLCCIINLPFSFLQSLLLLILVKVNIKCFLRRCIFHNQQVRGGNPAFMELLTSKPHFKMLLNFGIIILTLQVVLVNHNSFRCPQTKGKYICSQEWEVQGCRGFRYGWIKSVKESYAWCISFLLCLLCFFLSIGLIFYKLVSQSFNLLICNTRISQYCCSHSEWC